MLRELVCSLLLLSLLAGARPSTSIQLFDPEQAPATNESNNPPSFEELSREGWRRMRLPTPFTELKLISALPTNEQPSATSVRGFRHVVVVGLDTSRQRWLHICNQGGRNRWEPVRQIPNPPSIIQTLPSFLLGNYDFSFEDAFRQARGAGYVEPWAEVRLSAEEFGGRTGEISYVFMAPGFRHGVLVDVWSGDVRRIEPPVPPGQNVAGSSLVSGLDLRNLSSEYTVVETS